jgi:TonB family protein
MYKPGEDIWMAVWLTDGITNKASAISEIAYIELISPKGNIEESHRIMASNGRATCDFHIDSASGGGMYRIRAYTNWMQNFGEKYYFEKTIQVQNVALPRLLMKLDMQRKAYGAGDTVKADLLVSTPNNQKLANQQFTYTVNINGSSYLEQTTKTNSEGKSVISFALPQSLNSIDGTLNVAINFRGNTESITRPIPIVRDQIDLQFLPEGGDLVTETENNCAFKAINVYGKPADIEGTVFNKKHQIVARFKSYHQGMGAFKFTPVKGDKYYALIDRPEGILQLYPLPQPIDSGYLMEVPDPQEFINPKAKTTATLRIYSPINTSISIIGQLNGKIYYNASLQVKKGNNNIEIPHRLFPTGIAQFTLFTNGNTETCERLVLIKKNELLKLEITTDKPGYLPRQEVKLKVKATTPDGKPVATTLGIAVADNKQLTLADDKSDNILTYLLLSSELTGKIEEPNFYFNPNETKADTAIDYLLLTQGWRRFTWKDIAETAPKSLLDKLGYNPEKRILCGTIKAKSKDLLSTRLYIKETGQSTQPNKNGYYEFKGLDLTYPLTLIVISAQKDTIKRIIKDYSSASYINESSFFNNYFTEQHNKGYNTIGKVVDNTGNPLPGCNVVIKGTVIGTVTDINGNYCLKTDKTDILQFSLIGYNSMETKASHNKREIITLYQRPINLEEVIVVGYGMIRKREITGSVTTISNQKSISLEVNQDNTSRRTNKNVLKPVSAEYNGSKPSENKPNTGNVIDLTPPSNNSSVENNKIMEDAEQSVYCYVEQMPEYPGGDTEIFAYLAKSIRYPEIAMENGISGRVYVSFVVNENGQISEEKIIRNIDPSLDQEALRVIRNMPRWIPGRQNGRPIRMQMTMPINFRLMEGGSYATYNNDATSKSAQLNYYKNREFYLPQYLPNEEITERTDFRKTIYWNPAFSTDSTGYGETKFFTSDELTTFRVTTEGIGTQGEIGRSEYTFYTSKPVSLDVKMPENIVSGDTLSIPITINNTTNMAVTGQISYDFPKSMKLLNDLPGQVTIGANSTSIFYADFAIGYANNDGSFKIKFDANSYKDAISAPFAIHYQGFPIQHSYQGQNQSNQFIIDIPRIIPNTLKAEVVAYPNLLSTLSSSLEAMLREPHGCFEQASATTYPNILILQYLKKTKQSDNDMEQKALAFIDKGYKMLVNYETSTQGFEWFGKSPAHEGLTAYGLMEFTDMQQVYPSVDNTLIERTKSWLLNRRDYKGGFKITPGKYGFSNNAYLLNNAYVVYALSEIGCNDIRDEFEKAYTDNMDKADAYRIALLANAAINRKDTLKATSLLTKLRKMTDKHQITKLPSETSITGSTGKSLQVETASLIALALLKQPQLDSSLLEQCINFIVGERSFNSYGSTQATILALKALTQYAYHEPKQNGTVTISVNDKTVASGEYTAKQPAPLTLNNLEQYLKPGNNKLDITFNNSGATPKFNMNIGYNQTEPINSIYSAVTISTFYKQTTVAIGGTIRLTIVVANEKNCTQSMSIAMVSIPSGLSIQSWQIKELQEKKLFDYYEIKNNQLYLYFSTMEPNAKNSINLDLKAEIPGKYQPAASCSYLYYNPDFRWWCMGANIEVTK